MTTKKAIGFLLVAIPLVGIIGFDVYEDGWHAVGALAIACIVVASLVIGIMLLTEE